MLEYEVHSRAQLIAAVLAAAQPSFAAARANPVRITWGRCVYRFAEGIETLRAVQLVREIRRTLPRGAA